jgi:hypothetical protein
MISDFLQRPILRVHKEQIGMTAQVKTMQFLRGQVTVNVRRASNPSHCIGLNPSCRFNACCTTIDQNCMPLFVFPLSVAASWWIYIVLMRCFEPQYLYSVNIVALRLIMSLGLNDAKYTTYYTQHFNVSDYMYPISEQSWNCWELESIRLPLNLYCTFTVLSLCWLSPLYTHILPHLLYWLYAYRDSSALKLIMWSSAHVIAPSTTDFAAEA